MVDSFVPRNIRTVIGDLTLESTTADINLVAGNGEILLPADPTVALGSATKQYVDTATANVVTNAGTSTDDAVATWDGTTGKIIQNSLAILSATGDLSGLIGLDVNGVLNILLQSSLASASAIQFNATDEAGGIDMDTGGGLTLNGVVPAAEGGAANIIMTVLGAAGAGRASTASAGGLGGALSLTSGAGGAITATGTGTAGAGANIDILAGNGGDAVAAGTNGDGGDININSGVSGAGGGAAGTSGTINIGNNVTPSDINMGTGAAARTITVGNSTGITAVTLATGTGGVNFPRATITQATDINTAVTIDSASGVITTVSATTAALDNDVFIVNNNRVTTASVVTVSIVEYGGVYATNGFPIVQVTTVGAGVFSIVIINVHATVILAGVLEISFVVV